MTETDVVELAPALDAVRLDGTVGLGNRPGTVPQAGNPLAGRVGV